MQGEEAVLTGQALIQDIRSCDTAGKKAAFWWLGQLGFCFKLGETVLYVDAFLSSGLPRIVPPLLKPDEVVNAHYIVGTHDHIDHIDRASWPAMAKASPSAKFVAPGLLTEKLSRELGIPLSRFLALDDGETVTDGGVSFTGIAAAHEFLDRDPETGRYPHMCVSIQAGGANLFHSGDTLVYDGLTAKILARGAPDIMALPINGRDGIRYRRGCIGNMTYQEAADLAGRIGPGLVLPAHYDMFADNSENPYRFAEYLEAKYPRQRFWLGGHGTRVLV